MARRAGLVELAEAAGVSLSTVDRCLNGREQVSATARARILAAAVRLGHPAALRLGVSTPATLPEVRFGVVLHKQGQEFYKAFADELKRAVAQLQGVRGRLVLEFAASQAPSEMAGMLRSMAGRCDVLAATAVNHPEVTSAVEYLKSQNLRVFSLLSDFGQGLRAGYLGLNNLKVGRTAGWITSLAAKGPGKVLLYVGGHRFHGHELRETGFRSYLREMAPQIEVLETVVNLETRALTYETTLAALNRHADLRGVFVTGGGMEGAIAALRGARAPGEVVLCVSELTPDSRAGLVEGLVTMVTATPLEKLCSELFQHMVTTVQQEGQVPDIGQIFLAPNLHFPESI
ncbi:substrate-binding domain-containing protein [Rhodobacteraceae bacterium CYK-10]|uniref:Substrate-binding domain-containing protein n=2 Tax=Stagnihabitans tardus TaxID=2699202 RepID=A0AAE5BU69_9RHOB|nr:substrate-binding domain-containing protein [Stagnihabitans tardus]